MSDHLIIAAANGETDKVLTLLQEGADINATDQLGRTAIVAATYYNQVETVRALIQHDADVNIQDIHLENVLLHAGASGFLEIVKLAIAAGANTKLTNRFGGVAIIPAAERGHVEVVRVLLNHSDIDVNHINNLHWTALMEAVILGNGGERHQEIVQLLVDYGANLNITDRDGVTPLQHAKQLGFHKIELILKEAESEGYSKR